MVKALQNLMKTFQAIDGLRETFPNAQHTFTLLHNGNSHQSQIDCIYIHEPQLISTHEWNIDDTAIPTDHKLISVSIAIPNTPYIGKGHWSIPNFVLGNKKFIQKIENIRIDLLKRIDPVTNPNSLLNTDVQLEWASFKVNIIDIARETSKTSTT
jgi:hypothetical protein